MSSISFLASLRSFLILLTLPLLHLRQIIPFALSPLQVLLLQFTPLTPPPTSSTSSRSPPSATTGYSGRFSTGSGGPNVQSPEAIEDSQRWDSPPTSIGFSGRNGGGGGGSSGGSGSLMNTGSFQHSHATSPNFREGSQSGGFDQSLRGAGGYNSRREGSNGSVRRFHLLFDEVSRTHQVVENRLFLP